MTEPEKITGKIIIGISGGVDSAVSALLLKEQGFDVEAVFMQNWQADDHDPHCKASQDLTDARMVCDQLRIPLRTVSFAKTYWDKVFSYFLDEYASGRTPNPDILCNKEIKFKAFLDFALAQGATKIATGHYARIQQDDQGQYYLLKGQDSSKDQSYFLHQLNQNQLAHALFPLGELEKAQVRKIAQDHNLLVHAKKDSTGICFIGERHFKDFLNEYLLAKPGNIETTEGEIIGKHDGLMFYTIGQRKGIGIGGRKDTPEDPWFVVSKDIERNTLVIGQGEHSLLFSDHLTCENLHWITGTPPEKPLSCTAKIRYRQEDKPCALAAIDNNQYQVTFEEPQRAITPGQSVVFYHNDICLGGAVIL